MKPSFKEWWLHEENYSGCETEYDFARAGWKAGVQAFREYLNGLLRNQMGISLDTLEYLDSMVKE